MSRDDPEARMSHLPTADGSATFSYAGYTIVGAVNGPIEVQRRDELPEEAAIDVVVRPAAGVGGTRERHLESILEATLRQIILVNSFPRTLIQVVLQVTVAPDNEYVNAKVAQASLNLPMLPALLETAVLSLLSAGLPLNATITSASFSINASMDDKYKIIPNPTPRQVETSRSFHVFAFTSHEELLLAESEGSFTTHEWDDLYSQARASCCPPDADIVMDDERGVHADLKNFVRTTMQEKIVEDLHWKTLG
ncbi:exosome complex component RRP46 [Microdochium nivale]|nr:exosome complex component RRP46 [Microdochium nivale]